jgi:hypothetical protein
MKVVHSSQYPINLTSHGIEYSSHLPTSFLDHVLTTSTQPDKQTLCREILDRLSTCYYSPLQQSHYLCLYVAICNTFADVEEISDPLQYLKTLIQQALLMISTSDHTDWVDLSSATQYLLDYQFDATCEKEDKGFNQYLALTQNTPRYFSQFDRKEFLNSVLCFFEILVKSHMSALGKTSVHRDYFNFYVLLLLGIDQELKSCSKSQANLYTSFLSLLVETRGEKLIQHLLHSECKAFIQMIKTHLPHSNLPTRSHSLISWLEVVMYRNDLEPYEKCDLQLLLVQCCKQGDTSGLGMQILIFALNLYQQASVEQNLDILEDLSANLHEALIPLLRIIEVENGSTLDAARLLALTAQLTALKRSSVTTTLFSSSLLPAIQAAITEASPEFTYTPERHESFHPLFANLPCSKSAHLLSTLSKIATNPVPICALEGTTEHTEEDLFLQAVNPFIEHLSSCIQLAQIKVDWDTLLNNYCSKLFKNFPADLELVDLQSRANNFIALVGIVYYQKYSIPFSSPLSSNNDFKIYLLSLLKNAPAPLTQHVISLIEEI